MSSRITYANDGARLAEWIAERGGEAAAIDFLVAHLAGGGSVPEFVRDEALGWGVLAAWIRNDRSPGGRNQRYQEGMQDRSALRRERLIDGWWETVAEKPEEGVRHSDVHRAREALARVEGMFKETMEVTGKDGGALLPMPDVTTIARKVAFLLRKGVEMQGEDVTDAEVVQRRLEGPEVTVAPQRIDYV